MAFARRIAVWLGVGIGAVVLVLVAIVLVLTAIFIAAGILLDSGGAGDLVRSLP